MFSASVRSNTEITDHRVAPETRIGLNAILDSLPVGIVDGHSRYSLKLRPSQHLGQMFQVVRVEDLSLPIFPINVALGSAPTFLQVTVTFGIQPATPCLLGIFPLGAALSALLPVSGCWPPDELAYPGLFDDSPEGLGQRGANTLLVFL
ncbi:MAG TPA: hypothetical protein VN648_33760, partial [Candidatus Methylomirabilis sp.]|nr:hypothetical protein [Candidatus Methylomirabilis sp.]